MNTKHTPGPWEVNGQNYGQYITIGIKGKPKRGNVVARVPWGADDNDNAHLIAAAPDLLMALKVCRGQWIHSVNADQCLNAIKKAEGF